MSSPPRYATPASEEMSVREARDLYLRENGFTLAMYREPSFTVPVGPFTIRLPNPPERQRVVDAHDLHHVLTGYGTDWTGEVEVSVWEVRGGMGGSWIAWMICIPFALAGFVVRPRQAFRAWQDAKGSRSLLGREVDRQAILDLPVAEARRRHGIPARGASRHPARLNPRAPLVDPGT